ncbi:MAG: hypothetical protein DI630_33580 [Gordonia sp. (in: high G+C Gram-positive bacteria)]|nr:MAG: hypothetical protein DI630_33580 [Gordonia sp. (in: high G+C Gram-positive bacteria)]
MPRPSPTPPPTHPGLHSEFEHPAVDLTLAQVIALLERADQVPGGTRELLEVTGADGTTTRLEAPQDLAGIKDLDQVQHIVQRVRYGSGGEYVVTVGVAGIQAGTVGAREGSPARTVSALIRQLVGEQGLEPRGLAMAPLQALVMMMALCVGIGAPLMAAGIALELPLIVRIVVIMAVIAMLPTLVLPRIMTALQGLRPHWLQRESTSTPRIGAAMGLTIGSIVFAVVSLVACIWVVG